MGIVNGGCSLSRISKPLSIHMNPQKTQKPLAILLN